MKTFKTLLITFILILCLSFSAFAEEAISVSEMKNPAGTLLCVAHGVNFLLGKLNKLLSLALSAYYHIGDLACCLSERAQERLIFDDFCIKTYVCSRRRYFHKLKKIFATACRLCKSAHSKLIEHGDRVDRLVER